MTRRVTHLIRCFYCREYLDIEDVNTHFPHKPGCRWQNKDERDKDEVCNCQRVAHESCCKCDDLAVCF